MYVKRNNKTRSYNHCCSGKAINITYSVYTFVASVTKQAKRMYSVTLLLVACLTVPYFPTLSHKNTISGKKDY
jgi:hypothetical protein